MAFDEVNAKGGIQDAIFVTPSRHYQNQCDRWLVEEAEESRNFDESITIVPPNAD